MFSISYLLIVLSVSEFSHGNEVSKVYELVYQDFDQENSFDACIRMTNGTSQVGCQSSMNGNVGVLVHIMKENNVTFFIDAHSGPYVALVPIAFLSSNLVHTLENTHKISGILAYQYEYDQGPEAGWSTESKCPNMLHGLYSKNYGPDYFTCDWNPNGNELNQQDISIPIFVMRNDSVIEKLINCSKEYNNDLSAYPLCAVELKSFMHSAQSSETCIRRNGINLNLETSVFCDEIGGSNIYTSVQPTNNSNPLVDDSVILVMAPIDSRSFLNSFEYNGANELTGLIALLAVAETIGKMTTKQKNDLNKNIVFLFFDAEKFDYIGSKRAVFDMIDGVFPMALIDGEFSPALINLTHISHIMEFGQLGFTDNNVYVHYDPISYDGDENIKNQTDSLIKLLNTQQTKPNTLNFVKPSVTRPIPPSSIQSFLRQRNMTAVLLSDFDTSYLNKNYDARFDTLSNLGVKFNKNSTEEEIKVQLKPLAQKLTDIATVTSSALYNLSGSSVVAPPTANTSTVVELLYCFLHNDSCEYLKQFVSNETSGLKTFGKPFKRYVGTYNKGLKTFPYFLRNIMLMFIGDDVPPQLNCSQPGKDVVYNYKAFEHDDGNFTCKRAQIYGLEAKTPHEDIKDYDFATSYYQVWTESRWGLEGQTLRMFLINAKGNEVVTLIAGLLMLVSSLLIVFVAQKQRKILFSTTIEPL